MIVWMFMNERRAEEVDEWMSGLWIDCGWSHQWMDQLVDQLMERWVDYWMNGWMDQGWIDRSINREGEGLIDGRMD